VSRPAIGPVDPPAIAAEIFGARLPLAVRYAELLVTAGIERGVLGPAEVPRIWERHLLNCAVVTDLLPSGAQVVDVGSGAGLPGLALACRRPDLRVVLVESLARRVAFLRECAADLGVSDQIQIVHGRAEDSAVVAELRDNPFATARALAPLDRLVRWCLPLVRSSGLVLAIKGQNAQDELTENRASIRRAGGDDGSVVQCGVGLLTVPTSVVVITRRR
jgi:16S rRNA (guanine527-N7)-methyltransferase